MSTIRPTAITADRQDRQLTIKWSDDHESSYSFSLLRHACPCVECRGGHDKMGSAPDESVFYLPDEDAPETRLENIEAVGTYALTIAWEDGHHFGIYTWNFLQELCPCDECRGDHFLT